MNLTGALVALLSTVALTQAATIKYELADPHAPEETPVYGDDVVHYDQRRALDGIADLSPHLSRREALIREGGSSDSLTYAMFGGCAMVGGVALFVGRRRRQQRL
eukprot:comp25080_c0_seq1/m.46949 comp25080_c0_seq1/g.46949  ORF comp25080_c0_seq1/g.46949 comp25080_c0_seq1/m.46949 type:complete len:105 (-) comp25080_c0_seq1:577-891(-)